MGDAVECCGICFICCACFAICGRGCAYWPCCRRKFNNDDDDEFVADVERAGRAHEMDLFTQAQPSHHAPLPVNGYEGAHVDKSLLQTGYPDRITAHEQRNLNRDSEYPDKSATGEQRNGHTTDPPEKPPTRFSGGS